MQDDKTKFSVQEIRPGIYADNMRTDAFVWYEKDWKHDGDYHMHQRYQLAYVEDGYQYFHIEQKIYLVPQNHVIWIPTQKDHRTTSDAETVNLMIVLFKKVPKLKFYEDVHVFQAPAVLKEMLLYASKWNKQPDDDGEHALFLKALLKSLPHFCNENRSLQIPVPLDSRLIPVCDHMNKNYPYRLELDKLAYLANMSVRSLQRAFKQETGITLQKYMQLIRVLKSIELMDTKKYTLSEIAFMVGYHSLSAFTSSYHTVMKTKAKRGTKISAS